MIHAALTIELSWHSEPDVDYVVFVSSRLSQLSNGVLVDLAALHDDLEVPGGVGDQIDVVQRIAVDKQQVGERALLHDAKLAGIRTAFAGQCQQLGVGLAARQSAISGSAATKNRSDMEVMQTSYR